MAIDIELNRMCINREELNLYASIVRCMCSEFILYVRSMYNIVRYSPTGNYRIIFPGFSQRLFRIPLSPV